MDRVTEDILIAEGRCKEFDYEHAYIFPRSLLDNAPPDSENQRLKELLTDYI